MGLIFDEIFKEVPVSGSIYRYWLNQPVFLLESASRKIKDADANPWCFVADARHFWQFAGDNERKALASFSREEANVLLGWEDEDWDPGTFGYE